MRDLKPLSALDTSDREAFLQGWTALTPERRNQIAHAMFELAEDNVDLDFNAVLFWLLDDQAAEVRTVAIEGLWENTSLRLMRKLLELLRDDPSAEVRASAALGLSHFAYQSSVGELDDDEISALHDGLFAAMRDETQTLDVRRRALESAGYFGDEDEVEQRIEQAYGSAEQLLRESALVAMGRSMDQRWLPTIGAALGNSSPALRYEAARAAGEIAEDAQSLVPRLVPMIEDDDSEVALAAIWALGQIGGERARRALQNARKSSNETRSLAATEALEELTLGEGLVN
ncbi:MAG TPA: HEAT repeat domain-containing protein [Roseiflexaceae bacterium]|nr:HEAT repeat domain-containing protein [Roseiflexaceae bacterium]